jgi:hypothetical protein
VSKFLDPNRQTLCRQAPSAGADADTLLALQRSQLHAAHRLVCGQELHVIFQIWQAMPGHVTQRQLCPVAAYGGAQDPTAFAEHLSSLTSSPLEPVFQFVVGRKYYLSFLIQNRDPTCLRKLPFTDVIEARLPPASAAQYLPAGAALQLNACRSLLRCLCPGPACCLAQAGSASQHRHWQSLSPSSVAAEARKRLQLTFSWHS